MAGQGRNEGFYVLDEFVCEAIHAPSIPLAGPANPGRNEGMSVIEELVFEAGSDASSDAPDDHRRLPLSLEQVAALKSVIEPVATYISASTNPRGALAHFVELLVVEINGIDRGAAEWLGQWEPTRQPAAAVVPTNPRPKAGEGR
jgi:hypothetical protein